MKEFFARLNPTERRFVVGVGVVFFLVLNIVFVWPHFGDWGRTRQKMTTARNKLATFEKGANDIPALKRDIAIYQKGGEVVPAEDQMIRFFRLIQSQASASGVIIITMGGTRQTASDNPFFVEQNQTITVQSSETNLVNFLYHLGADSNSLIRVRDLSIQPDSPRQQLVARVTLVASYQRNAPALGKAAATATPKTAPPTAAPKPATPAAPKATAPPPAAKPPTSGTAAGPKPLLPKPGLPGLPGSAPGTNALKPLTPNKK